MLPYAALCCCRHLKAMGCTSSAPASLPPTPRANATGSFTTYQDTDLGEEINVLQSKQLQTVATIELPECDTVMKQVDVAMVASNNNESSMKIASPLSDPTDENGSPVIEYGNQGKTKDIKSHDDAKDSFSAKSDEKIINIENLVEKAVELYIADSNTASALSSDKSNETSTMPNNGDIKAGTSDYNTSEETQLVGNEEEEEEYPSLVSPSQSQSSRATRWEALADVAAELPPSLTVDPLTGQIYAVSK